MFSPFDDVSLDIKEYAIGGKLVTAAVSFSQLDMINMDSLQRDAVRRRLVEELASEMLSQNLVEIMQMQDPINYTTRVAARAYIAPDSQVKILRSLKTL